MSNAREFEERRKDAIRAAIAKIVGDDEARWLVDLVENSNPYEDLWVPREAYGWTWVHTTAGTPETHSLLDRDGELMAHVYNRWNRVICWAPFIWGDTVYVSHEDCGEYGFEDDEQRQHHFARIGEALTEWVGQKRAAGVDLVLLRDTQAHNFECKNGHLKETVKENDFPVEYIEGDEEEARAIEVAGWTAVPLGYRYCEAYRLRDRTGRMRGQVQVRYGVVRVVAANERDIVRLDPRANPDYYLQQHRSCAGEIVLQAKHRPLALRFEDGEREHWLRVAVEALRDGSDTDADPAT